MIAWIEGKLETICWWASEQFMLWAWDLKDRRIDRYVIQHKIRTAPNTHKDSI